MDPHDSDIFSCSQQQSNYTMSSQFSNQSNQSFEPVYHFNPTNGTYPSHVDLQYASRIPFQSLLNTPTINTPMTNTQNQSAPKGQKKRVKDQFPNISQGSIVKKDWTKEEEIALTNAWLYVSVDAIVGNNQKNTAMWVRIHQVWKENMGTGCKNLRSSNSLQCHWGKIHAAVNNFIGHYDRLDRHPQSGTNFEDLIKKAMGLYEDIEGSEFKFVHCWEIMIKNPKWYSNHGKKTASNKQNVNESKSPTIEEPLPNTSDDIMAPESNSDGVIRPQGRKICKEKKRKLHEEKSVVDALNKLQCILEKQMSVNVAGLEMRRENEQKEFQLKEQVMKKEIELKENAQKLKIKGERRKNQERILSQDLSKLSPTVQAAYEVMQAHILKEWESDDLFGTNTDLQA